MDVRWVKRGTQIIDGVWRQMKLKGVPKEQGYDEAKVDEYVRMFQWHHWNAERDMWVEMGKVFASRH